MQTSWYWALLYGYVLSLLLGGILVPVFNNVLKAQLGEDPKTASRLVSYHRLHRTVCVHRTHVCAASERARSHGRLAGVKDGGELAERHRTRISRRPRADPAEQASLVQPRLSGTASRLCVDGIRRCRRRACAMVCWPRGHIMRLDLTHDTSLTPINWRIVTQFIEEFAA
jgi:hypothetical protein